MKRLTFLAFLALTLFATTAKAQLIGVFIDDVDKYTNVRSSPGGPIVERIEAGDMPMFAVERPRNGWWLITGGTYEKPDQGEIELKGSPNNQYWIHYSVIGVGTRNYGGETYYLRATPKSRGKVVYSFKDEISLRPIDVRGDWVKVKTYDGKHTGWIEADKLCGNSLTNCC